MPETRYYKGDRVQFQLGFRPVRGTVKEDCGPIGIKGRHLYLVEFQRETEPVRETVLPAEDLQPVPDAVHHG